MDIKEFGFTQEELQNRLIEQLAESFWSGPDTEPDAIRHIVENKIAEVVRKKIDESFKAILEPGIGQFIEKLVLTPTNKWGEPIKEPITFKEYLAQAADRYITEEVNYQGKSRGQDSYNWSANGTRICFLIHEHIQYHVKTAVEKALKDFNAKVAVGLAKTVEIQLEQTLKNLKVQATV